MKMSRQKYYMVVLPVAALVFGYLGYWLNENHGVEYGPTGIAIAVVAILGLLLPSEHDDADDEAAR